MSHFLTPSKFSSPLVSTHNPRKISESLQPSRAITMAAIKNTAAGDEEERLVIDEDLSSDSEQLEEEEDEDDVSLCDLPVNLIKKDQTQFPATKSESAHANIETHDQEFDFGSSMRGGSNFLADTKMCAADEVFFQGQILPLRLSVSSDTGFNGLARRCPSGGGGLRSNSCRSRISDNSSFSSSSSSTTNSTTTTTTTTGIASAKPRRPRNQFYTEPSPKPQIKIPNSRLEKAGSRRDQSSSAWGFFRLGLVRTPDIELQDFNKVVRTNSGTNKSCVSRNSSVSSTNSTNFVANFNNAALKSEDTKQRKQRFFSVHGCKCSFDTVASDNIIVKNGSSSGRSNDRVESGRARGTDADYLKEEVVMELRMKKNNKKQKQKQQKQKEAMSHHRTYEWLKQLSHANSPSNLPVHV